MTNTFYWLSIDLYSVSFFLKSISGILMNISPLQMFKCNLASLFFYDDLYDDLYDDSCKMEYVTLCYCSVPLVKKLEI